MKTVEQKVKAYDEALERARLSRLQLLDIGEEATEIEYIFPELKEESEDERISKEIIKYLEQTVPHNHRDEVLKSKEWTAWLEKQAEVESDKDDIEAEERDIRKAFNKILNEKQGEQKPADKEEPKFHKGEWITNGDYTWKIVEIKPLDYILQSQDGNMVDDTISHVDEQFHSFTIQDAKNGDVLFDGSNILLVKEINHWHNVTSYLAYSQVYGIREYLISGSDVFTPATKEQRDLLFKKMHEAGYEWDAEKKELKVDYPDNLPKDNWELVHEFVEKFGRIPEDEDELNILVEYVLKRYKVTLGEEDEKMREQIAYAIRQLHVCECTKNRLLAWLKSLKPQPKQEWSEDDEKMVNDIIAAIDTLYYHGMVNWLKSLKQKYAWKPSKEQMNALWDKISNDNLPNSEKEISQQVALTELYEQLKKLKEE